MNTFDAPSRESCVVRRERTNTPLQALLLMNEEQYIEAARSFAERMLDETSKDATDDTRIHRLFETALLRPASEVEVQLFAKFVNQTRTDFENDSEAAKKLIGIGELPPKSETEPSELAAWTMAASMIMNMDEYVTKN